MSLNEDYKEYFSDAELAEYKEIFNTYDTDGDGGINVSELADVFKTKLGMNLSPAQ